jgi:hypothetical protein
MDQEGSTTSSPAPGTPDEIVVDVGWVDCGDPARDRLAVGVHAQPLGLPDRSGGTSHHIYRPALVTLKGETIILGTIAANALASLLHVAVDGAETLHKGQSRYGVGPHPAQRSNG